MIDWFGRAPWAPACQGASVPTPVGSTCLACKERIEEDDQGFIDISRAKWHRECLLRSMLGSPSHLLGRCSCGRTPLFALADPGPLSVMTYRDEARWVWDHVVERPS